MMQFNRWNVSVVIMSPNNANYKSGSSNASLTNQLRILKVEYEAFLIFENTPSFYAPTVSRVYKFLDSFCINHHPLPAYQRVVAKFVISSSRLSPVS